MIQVIKNILKKLHRCNYDTPIVSRYVGFSTRDIIYQCTCGKKKSYMIYRNFGIPFPIETNCFMERKEFKEILESDKIYPTK